MNCVHTKECLAAKTCKRAEKDGKTYVFQPEVPFLNLNKEQDGYAIHSCADYLNNQLKQQDDDQTTI